ncbi:chemotaxis protein CheW [Alsobacter sp. SYSU M60028]|uniref:Chemotaxis protein CheW n=1 Tax=Alsobacter ponti TaxID=2962936 RepID=A0ABT1LEE9_9HYPH|nr:chemotaxis protein CheW [Alsobacter ponti]
MQVISSNTADIWAPPAPPQQVLIFKVGEQTFGIPVDLVREIKCWQKATALPDAPPYMLGVINLRGQVIPIYDLAARLGRNSGEKAAASVVIVVEDDSRQFGILADSVSDILDLSPESIRRTPVGEDADGLIEALVVRDDDVVPLLRISAIATE